MESYEIMLGRQPVGQVFVEKQGLYYHFTCRCRLGDAVMYRVNVCCGGHHENLGILMPMGTEFGLEKKLPVKKVGAGELSFRVMPKHGEIQGDFYPVYPEEPFSYIARLQNAFLQVRNGQVGVIIREQ